MAGDEENPVPPRTAGEGASPEGGAPAPPVEGATKMFSLKIDSWMADFVAGDDLFGTGPVAPPPDAAAAAPLDVLDIAPVAAPTPLVAQAPRVVLAGLIPPPDPPPAGRASRPDLLADLAAEPPARTSGVDLIAPGRASAPPTIDPLGAPTIDPLAPPLIVPPPAPPPGVSAAAMLIGLPREAAPAERGKGTLIVLLIVLILVTGAGAAFVLFGDRLPFLKAG